MEIHARALELRLANPWKISSSDGSAVQQTVILEMRDHRGTAALGEAAPAAQYGESADQVVEYLRRLPAGKLSFTDVPGSMACLETVAGLPAAAKCAVNLALLDGAAKRAGRNLHEFLGLGFREGHHVTSFTIGIDTPETVRHKVLAAAEYPVMKLKLGDPRDRENLAALRSVAPDKPVRVDANEGWKTREEALRNIEWLAARDRRIQFIEQPLPRDTRESDLKWLKERSPLPVFGDEACHTVADIPRCAECFHGVNVKLVKAGGVTMAKATLEAARKAGLRTMIGCMVETSIEISAAAHLAELADYLDVDGSLLITNDPFEGVTARNGVLSFKSAKEKLGLQASLR